MVFPSTVHFTILNAAAKLYYKPAGICKLYGGQNLGIALILTGEKAVTSATKAEELKDGAPARPSQVLFWVKIAKKVDYDYICALFEY